MSSPVTPISVIPLHGFAKERDQWWACLEPERPHNESTVYDLRCSACRIKAEVTAQLAPEVIGNLSMAASYEADVTIGDAIARARLLIDGAQ